MFYYDHLRISRLIVLSSDAKVVFLTRCTLGQNIYRLFHFVAQFRLTTSETKVDYYHQKVNVRVTQPSNQKPNFDVFW